MFVTADKKTLVGNADADASYPEADPDAFLNLSTYNDYTEADLCIKMMYLCCNYIFYLSF